MPTLHVVDHPLVQHKLTLMRRKEASTSSFRRLLREVSLLIGYEITRDLPLEVERIETPIAPMDAPILRGKKVCFVAVLRAGLGMLDGMLDIVPSARVGHIGLYRDPQTLRAVEYYFKVPGGMEERDVIVLDPMLATGHSAIAAISRIKATRPRSVRFACILAAPEGIEALHEAHPDVPITTAAVDERLNDKAYIVPGLGDAGDRIFGTK